MSTPSEAPEWLGVSCHCQAIRLRFRVREWKAVDCNCSICRKKAYIHYFALPEDVEFLTGVEAITTYRFQTGTARHTFCSICGVAPYYYARSHPGHIDINLRCLDAPDNIAHFKRSGFDGQHWEANIDSLIQD